MTKGFRGRINGSALGVALLVSLSVHASGFAWFYTRGPETKIASTKSTSLSVVGSIEELVEGSREVIEPIEPEPPEELEPREHDADVPLEQVNELKPVETVAPQVIKSAPAIEGVTIQADIEPVEPEKEAEPVKHNLEAEPLKPAKVEEVKPVKVAELKVTKQPAPVDQKMTLEVVEKKAEQEKIKSVEAELVDLNKQVEAKQESAKELKPVDEAKELEPQLERTEVASASVPVPRPAPPRPEVKREAKPEKVAKRTPKKAKKKRAQKAGNAKINSIKGSTVARKGANTAKKGNNIAGSGDSAGNAATSNYWGRMARKLQRSANSKYPRREKRRNKSGQVTVAFTVYRNGSVSGISVARSSGNQRFDAAALKAVRTAAPFGPFPSSIRAKSVRKVIPITFQIK